MTGSCRPLPGGNLSSAVTWKLEFREGGVGRFLPFFFAILDHVRRHVAGADAADASDAPAGPMATPPVGEMQRAFVDPTDPSRMYVQYSAAS